MMPHSLTCRNLPFEPVPNQVIYVSRGNDEEVKEFICGHYQWLRHLFSQSGLEFCYLPLLAEEVIRYNAPYLSDPLYHIQNHLIPDLANYIFGDNALRSTPLLAFITGDRAEGSNGTTIMQCMPVHTLSDRHFGEHFRSLRDAIRISIDLEQGQNRIRFSKVSKEVAEPPLEYIGFNFPQFQYGETRVDPELEKDTADRLFDQESQVLVDEIKVRIEALRRRGVNTLLLRDLLDEPERLSRLHVTSDYRLLLPDYGDREIKMTLLPKAVYILFLRHLEGIRFKDLSDYYEELLQIYRELSPFGSDERQEQSIRDITDPTKNSINEKCARIREAFISQFDDRLARHYYITGQRGAPKRITLPSHLISWEKR